MKSKWMLGVCLLTLSVFMIFSAYATGAVLYADSEFSSASVSLYTTEKASVFCQLYEKKSNIAVNSCWLQKKVNGSWVYECSLDAPGIIGTNTHAASATMDYSSDIGSGTFRIGATFNADGHLVTRYSNERSF